MWSCMLVNISVTAKTQNVAKIEVTVGKVLSKMEGTWLKTELFSEESFRSSSLSLPFLQKIFLKNLIGDNFNICPIFCRTEPIG